MNKHTRELVAAGVVGLIAGYLSARSGLGWWWWAVAIVAFGAIVDSRAKV